jgi:Uma2 family endonuclease
MGELGPATLVNMSTVRKRDLISVDAYLADELTSNVKHEYLGGFVYAKAGARNVHNLIAGNIFASLHARLRGTKCRPYNSDTKIRVRLPMHVRFYYPDTSVVCRPNPPTDSFQDEPTVIIEVLSRETRRTDEGEKKEAYLSVPSVGVYLMVEQDLPSVAVYRRTDQNFERELYEGTDAVIPLPDVGTDLPLAEIYDGVVFDAIEE